jgi:aryl-alcohol dehydrogenase-like predicted oxidoreductase
MRARKLGRSELEVPVVVFGAWAIGGWEWGGRDAESDRAAVAAMQRALEVGMTAIDTAPIYGFGHSEELVGRALAGRRREDVVVMTKAGLRWDDERGKLAYEGPDDRGVTRRIYRNARPDSVLHECDASLRRLAIDAIDLLQIHWPDPTTPIADTMGALADLVHAGKVRAVGVSNYSVDELAEARAALGAIPLASDQPRYSLVRREIEADVLPYARDHHVGLVVYSPLEQGLLTGKVPADRTFPASDGRSRRASFRPENRAKVNAVLDGVVAPVAAEHAATLAQTALAWTLQQPGVTAVLAGARTAAQVDENAAAGDLVLSPDEWSAIDRAFAALELDLDR